MFIVSAGAVLWVAFLLSRGGVRTIRAWWKDERDWEDVWPYLLGLAALIYGVGWWLGYFPLPAQLAEHLK